MRMRNHGSNLAGLGRALAKPARRRAVSDPAAAGSVSTGLLIAVVFLCMAASSRAQQVREVTISPKALEVLNMPPLEVREGEDEMLRLKKLRFNAALNEAKDRYALYKKGLTQLTDLMEVGQRVLRAQADLAQTPQDRVAVLQKQVEIYQEAEANLERQVRQGIGQSADLQRLRYNMLGVQIDLLATQSAIQH
jgi:hypothetical protein